MYCYLIPTLLKGQIEIFSSVLRRSLRTGLFYYLY